MTTLVLIAKQPVAGKVKTRLHPDLSFEHAAQLAAASIDDTLASMRSLAATRRILLFEGNERPPGSEAYELWAQTGGTLDQRLADLFDACDGPTVLIGMDTPQLTAEHLAPAFGDWPHDVDAWFGPATDGGFWALGMREPRGDVIRDVAMSRPDTGAVQLQRLDDAGMRVGLLAMLTDVDTIDSARDVAAAAPHTQFARMLTDFEVRV